MNNPTITPQVVNSPFGNFCMSIGAIPTSYKDSLDYYETLLWLIKFLDETVIPAVNNNGNAVAELQNLYVELKDYVEHYFENLDVQEEINNKLDEMVEDGTLQEIVASYLDTKAIFGFDNVASMKEATNLIDGSYAETLGFYEKNDGGSSIYKIRSVTNEDTVDEMTIIALSNNSLVAELIVNNEINSMQLGIKNNILTDVSDKLNKLLSLNINKYIIKKGIYYIDNNLNIISNSHIVFEEGAVIQRIPTSNNTYFMLNIGNCENVTIENAHVIGDKDTHLGDTGEWGYGIHIYGSQNIIVKDSIIEKTWGDGIYVGYSFSDANPSPCENILIDNCQVLSCSRNGYSICAGNYIKLNDCYSYNNKRTNPKSGLDIEAEAPNGSELILDFIEINNFRSESNTNGISVRVDNDFNNIVINGHNGVNDFYGLVVYGLNGKGNMIYENANIIKSRISAIQITKKNSNLVILRNINIDGRTISDNTHNYQGAIHILTSSADDGNLIIDNVLLNNSFSDTYLYQDIICETGTGTFNKLILKNIITTRYLCVNNVDMPTLDLTNCEFKTTSNGETINDDKHTIFNVIDIIQSLAVLTIRNIDTTIPNGVYKIRLVNNTVPYFLRVVFNDSYTVYLTGGNTPTSNKTLRTSNTCGYLIFEKYNNNIYVLSTSFINN